MTLNFTRLAMCGVTALGMALTPGHGMAAATCSAAARDAQATQLKNIAKRKHRPIILNDMGSLMFGGTVDQAANGETFHGDHGYAQYFIPQKARNYPLVMWHGSGQSGKTWESTPDGRDGFQQIFARRGWPVFIIDQPRRGRAGKTNVVVGPRAHNPGATESTLWSNFRLGEWAPPAAPVFFPGVQFAQDANSIDQFLRQQTGNTGPEPFPSAEYRGQMAATMASLLQRTGPSILMTHSHSGQYGWATAMKAPDLVKAVVAYEPGGYAFPESEAPGEIPTQNELLGGFMAPQTVPMAEFEKLTRIPIMIVFGENFSDMPNKEYGKELWRMVHIRAEQFVATVNRHGGDARIVDLPTIGICGNTHFPMSDLNNQIVADQLSGFLQVKRLDGRNESFTGLRKP